MTINTLFKSLLLCILPLTAMAQQTDVTQLTDAVYVDGVTAQPGSTVTLSVQVKNTTLEVRGFQFDLYLPTGVSVATDESGFPLVELSEERTNSRKMNFFDSSIQSDGSLRVLAYSSNIYTLTGTSGEVCTITLKVADNAAAGSRPLQFKNVVITDPDAVRYPISDTTAMMTISQAQSGIWGDLNYDGQVSIADVMLLINHIVGN